MSNLMSLIRRAPKRFSMLVAIVAAAIIVPSIAFAWGPDRPVFRGSTPATYPVFNSMVDNPQVGDERNFVRVREAGKGSYVNQVNFTPGKVYEVSVYFHNNAASNLNASGKGQAKDATLKMEVPNVVTGGVNAALTGTIAASNTKPLKVWDEAYGKNTSKSDIALRYVSGSARFTSNGAINGKTLPDSLFTTGAKLGYNSQNGEVPGCNEFSGFVTFKLRVDQPNFNVIKKVSVDNGKTWGDTATAKPGANVQYYISYQNTGTNQQDNVLVRDILPKDVTYTPQSTYIMNATTGGNFKKTVEGITTKGLNAGSYQPKGNVGYKFSAKLPSSAKLKCGTNSLVNTARVTTNAGYKEDTAKVTVKKECEPPVVSYVCKALTVTTVDRTHFKFNTSYAAQNATFKSVTYVIKNAAGQIVETKTSSSTALDYTRTTVGKYTVQATVTFTVNGQDKTATSEGCKGNFEVKEVPPKDIQVCELATKKIITIKENQFDASKHSKNLEDCKEKYLKVCELATKKIITIKEDDFDASKHSKNLNDCKEKYLKVCELATKKVITIKESDFDAAKHTTDLNKCKETPKDLKVCELATKKIITIKESDFDASKHSKDLNDCKEEYLKVCELSSKTIITIKESDFDASKHSKDLNKCKETPPTKIEVCDYTSKTIVTINEGDFDASKHTKDLSKCEETPVAPPELPKTGAGESIVAIFGLGALIASAGYYIASRRALNQ